MNKAIGWPFLEGKKVVYNAHFWAIVLIMAALTIFYNASHTDIASWFPWLKEVFSTEFIHDLHRSLFLIPLLYAGAAFRLRGALFCWIAFMVAVLPRALYFSPNPDSLMRTIAFALVALLASVLIALEQNRRQGEKEAFSKLEMIRQAYLSETLKAQEGERQRIAQELHDDTVQSLLVIANHSQSMISGDCGEITLEAKRQVEEIRDMALRMADDVRRLSYDLRPSILDSIGLLPAIRWLAERLSHENNISIEVVINGVERKLHLEAEVTIFRIVQEALSNIRRHSEATEARLILDFAPGNLKITVQDNGKGFCLPEAIGDFTPQGKLGLNGMCERARLLDATVDIQSKPGKGTIVTIEAPI